LHYFQLRDAKMALASALLKPYAVSRLLGIPWSATLDNIISQEMIKPFYLDPLTDTNPIAFNVSHQAGIVVITAVANYPPREAEVGVDVVCTSERRERDLETLMRRATGWSEFVDTHADVFAPGEAAYLKHQVLSSVPSAHDLPRSPSAQATADAKLRAFYALWALREAYVKLTGEALTASWLRDLEFKNFRPTRPTAGWDVPANEHEGDEVIRNFDMRMHGTKIEDVNMCLRSIGPDYMVATAVRTRNRPQDGLGWNLGPYEEVTLEQVLQYAEASW